VERIFTGALIAGVALFGFLRWYFNGFDLFD
jgi:hypothetical protein